MKLKIIVTAAMPDMEEELGKILQKAVDGRATIVEIAYGRSGDHTKKRILHFLNRKDIRKLYTRFEKTDKGWNRVYVHFRW